MDPYHLNCDAETIAMLAAAAGGIAACILCSFVLRHGVHHELLRYVFFSERKLQPVRKRITVYDVLGYQSRGHFSAQKHVPVTSGDNAQLALIARTWYVAYWKNKGVQIMCDLT